MIKSDFSNKNQLQTGYRLPPAITRPPSNHQISLYNLSRNYQITSQCFGFLAKPLWWLCFKSDILVVPSYLNTIS